MKRETNLSIDFNMSHIEDIDQQALNALIDRVEHAIANDLALESSDLQLLLNAIHTLMALQSRLNDKDVTLNKLRKLLGMVKSSEKRTRSSDHPAKPLKNATKKPRKPRQKVTPARVEKHILSDIKKGDACPACPTGILGKYSPKVLLRISGDAPLEAVKHIAEQLQCNLCDYVVTADFPDSVMQDGGDNQQYGYSARSVMAIYKHFSGVPYYHQGMLNGLFGTAVTASTLFDQCEYVANDIMPCFHALRREAANGVLFYIDDTSHRILDQKPEKRPNRNGKGSRLRSGIYTSGMIAVTDKGKEIYLYNTSLGHAGEFLDDILQYRKTGLPPPVIMSDALSSNKPTLIDDASFALCNAHGRRQFLDVERHFPSEVEHILNLYGVIWKNNKACVDENRDPEQRLSYHQQHSLPIMVKIKGWCDSYLASAEGEEHSGLGKACRYYVSHYEGLTQFCKTPGAPLDNNKMEEGLKVKIRSRKNSYFYKTQTGADVANVLTSIIATAYRNNINPFHYLNSLQRNKDLVKSHAVDWLPWSAPIAP